MGRGAVTPACVLVVARVHRAREAEPEGRGWLGRGGGTHGPPKTRPPLFGVLLLSGFRAFWFSAVGLDLCRWSGLFGGWLGLVVGGFPGWVWACWCRLGSALWSAWWQGASGFGVLFVSRAVFGRRAVYGCCLAGVRRVGAVRVWAAARVPFGASSVGRQGLGRGEGLWRVGGRGGRELVRCSG